MNIACAGEVTAIDRITGLWSRSLIYWPDGRRDATTSVRWLQTPSLFVDLRQPAGRPSFEGVRCLRDLDRTHVEWLALQEGFAGETCMAGRHVEWRRQFDFQPKAALPDAGRLWFDAEMMMEEGRDAPYVEHWHRAAPAADPCCGIALRDTSSGQAGMLVRAGAIFMYARARACDPPPGSPLRELIDSAAGARARQDLIDCEISFGRIGADGWRIAHSSLPFKEGQLLQPMSADPEAASLRTRDVAPDGLPVLREWQVTRSQGTLSQVLVAAAAGS